MKKLLHSKKSQLAFTLIELLIVIAIIVIIIAIGAVSFTTAQRTSRDSVRKSDLKKLQSALERFYADNGSYPDEQGDVGGNYDYFTCSITGDGHLPGHTLPTPIKGGDPFTCGSNTYMTSLPVDPITGMGYFYEVNENRDDGYEDPTWCDNPAQGNGVAHGHCQKYTLWTHLENTNDPLVLATTNDPICQVADIIEGSIPGDAGYNYCVHN